MRKNDKKNVRVDHNMDDKMKKVTRYINKDGEYIDRVSYVTSPIDDDGYLFWVNKLNVKTFIEQDLPKGFTWADRGRVEALKKMILRDNQFLCYRTNGRVKPIGVKEIANMLELSDRQTKTFVKKLKSNGIIKEVSFDNMRYFAFNPMYGFKGKRLSLNVYIFFQKELDPVLPEWVKREFLRQVAEIKPNIKVMK